MRKITFIISILLTALYPVFSQVHQDWVSRFNGPGNGNDESYDITVDASGNVYITGKTEAAGTGTNIATVMYNSSGVQQWFRIYNGPGNGNDAAYTIKVDGSGNVYVSGTSVGSGTHEDITTLKYNASGTQQWVKRYDGPVSLQEYGSSMAIDALGNVYVTGYGTGSAYNDDYITIKYNTAGVQQWVQRFDGQAHGDDNLCRLAIDGSANIYVTGASEYSTGNDDIVTIKYNSSGVQQWVAHFDGIADSADIPYAIAVDGSGNVFVTGYTTGVGTDHDVITIKYSPAGTQLWVKSYNGTANLYDVAYSLGLDGSGNVFVGGYVSTGPNLHDYVTIKYTASGVQQWVNLYDSPEGGSDIGLGLCVDGSGNVYVTGVCEASPPNADGVTIKYNSFGAQQWLQRYNGPANDHDSFNNITADGSGNVYVSGISYGSGTGDDMCTIKYSQQIGIRRISTEIPVQYKLFQNYPNPFNPKTKIKFEVPANVKREMSNVKIIIYDILGREIAVIVNEQLSPGTYEVEWDSSNYPSGVYYYSIVTPDFKETRKMVLIK